MEREAFQISVKWENKTKKSSRVLLSRFYFFGYFSKVKTSVILSRICFFFSKNSTVLGKKSSWFQDDIYHLTILSRTTKKTSAFIKKNMLLLSWTLTKCQQHAMRKKSVSTRKPKFKQHRAPSLFLRVTSVYWLCSC